MGQHNLGVVFGFEFFRTISKKRFWAGTLTVAFIMAVVSGLLYASNKPRTVPRVPGRAHGTIRVTMANLQDRSS